MMPKSANTTSDSKHWIYRWQGGRYDLTTGLYNFRNRDYSPTLGRWVQQDPIGYIDGANLYQAMLGAPIGNVDPMGLCAEGDQAAPEVWTPFDHARWHRLQAKLFDRNAMYQLGLYRRYGRQENLGNYHGWRKKAETEMKYATDWVGVGKLGGTVTSGSAYWSGFWEGWVQGGYGVVGGLTGGLFDPDCGFFGHARNVRDWLAAGGWGYGGIGYESGTNGARVFVGCTVAAGALKSIGWNPTLWGKSPTPPPFKPYPGYGKRPPGLPDSEYPDLDAWPPYGWWNWN